MYVGAGCVRRATTKLIDQLERSQEIINVKGGKTLLVNPGTVAGLGAPTATWAIGSLTTLSFEIRTLAK